VQQRKMIDESEGDRAHRHRLGQHLDAMLALCETVDCRRVRLLDYFGQESGPCGNCDTCLAPPESWDGTVAAQKVLSAVWRLKKERNQSFGAGHIVDILLGKRTREGRAVLPPRAVGVRGGRRPHRRRVARRRPPAAAQGLLAVQGTYQTFALTEASRPVLRGEQPVMLRRDPPKQARSRTRAARAPQAELPDGAAPVFERLRAWRAGAAKEQGLPAYVIFHDATLREIATRMPASLDELGTIGGIGQTKLARYGEQVLAALATD
jgi:ATP-dependent DNA helicase RecQ